MERKRFQCDCNRFLAFLTDQGDGLEATFLVSPEPGILLLVDYFYAKDHSQSVAALLLPQSFRWVFSSCTLITVGKLL